MSTRRRLSLEPTLGRVALVCLMLAGCQGESTGEDAGSGAGGRLPPGSGAGGLGAGGTAGSSGGVATGGTAGVAAAGGTAGSGGTAGVAGGGGAGAAGGSGGTAGAAPTGVSVSGRQIRIGGMPFHIQGVCWNPVPRGGQHPANLDFAGASTGDIPLMVGAGINAVRTYEPLMDRAVLDALYASSIYVLNTVYPYGEQAPAEAAARVEAVKDHPAILMWVVGNEWNYNGLYVGLTHEQALARVNEVAAAIRAVDTTHPISTVYGELPSADTLAAMPNIDVWGLNVYRGLGFGSLFDDWAARSSKPMYLAEYGADAWNANLPAEDSASQAEAVGNLTQQIWDNGSAHTPNGACAGGTVFEWADEWWKDSGGSPDEHDVGGVAPGGGPHPDGVFNEEWWGIVDIDRSPRPAYAELTRIFGG